MQRINRLKVSGFRRLRELDLPLRNMMVLIGANGVGKTTLLDTFYLLSASASGKLNSTLSELGGVGNLLTRGMAEELSLIVDMDVPEQQPLEYALSLRPKATGHAISLEKLTQAKTGYSHPFMHINSTDGDIRYYQKDEKNLVRPNWEHNPLETSLYQVPKMFQQPEELRRILSSATLYHVLDVGPRAPVRLPQQMKPAELPGANGEDLIPFLYSLRESDPDRFESVLNSLESAFPDFEDLSFPPVAAGMLTLTWKDKNFRKPIFLNELSEGTLRFLWLVALLQSPKLSTITMIDEPEVSLHPELLSLLADLMREASHRTQLVIATHSDRLIRFLKPEEVVVMDVDSTGCASARWSDSLDLDEWLKDYSLDEVWRMGRMGARS